MFDGHLLSKQSRIVVACALVGLLALNSANAADPEPTTVEVESIVQISITENVAVNFTVSATPPQAITILVDAIVDGTGYELGSVQCEYNADADTATACNSAGMSATSAASANLLVDATMTGDGLAVTERANISFDVTVAYH